MIERHAARWTEGNVKLALALYVKSTECLEAIAEGGYRVKLDGEPVKPVKFPHLIFAQGRLYERKRQ